MVATSIRATPASSDGRSLLDSLCREISRAYQADESDVPSEYNDLAVELGKRMELANADRPLILFLDALDQLSAGFILKEQLIRCNDYLGSWVTTAKTGPDLLEQTAPLLPRHATRQYWIDAKRMDVVCPLKHEGCRRDQDHHQHRTTVLDLELCSSD